MELNKEANRRITERLLRYWLNLRGAKQFPSENEVNIDDIADIWDSCFLVQVHGKDQFLYTYLGKQLIDAYGGDITSENVSKTLVSPYTKRVQKKFEEVIKTKQPVSDEADYMDTKKLTIKYRQILVPLGNDKGEVEYILGGMRWKAFM